MGKKNIYVLLSSIMILTSTLLTLNSEEENYEGHQSINNYISTECLVNTFDEIDEKYYMVSELIKSIDFINASPKPIPLNTIPDYFNWKDYEEKDWTTPARDQGACGSCGIFSALGIMECIINIRENNSELNPDLSEQYVLSCLPEAGSCNGSISLYDILYYIMNTSAEGNYRNGVITESCFPYQADDTIPCSEKCSDWEEKLIPISDIYYSPTNGSIEDRKIIKTLIMENGPISTLIYSNDDFINWGLEHHNQDDYYPYYETTFTNHAIIIIGWKDDETLDRGGYWICKNSWGIDWGYQGFFNIAYESMHIGYPLIVWVDYNPDSYDWPPIIPSMNGPINGKAGEEYEYIISSSDPDGDDDVYYYIEWGDGQVEDWLGPYKSDEELLIKHTWDEKGSYIIKVKAKDINDAESDWTTLEVSVPKVKYINEFNPLISSLIERFPIFEFLILSC
jgi:C1A family cysteine protease